MTDACRAFSSFPVGLPNRKLPKSSEDLRFTNHIYLDVSPAPFVKILEFSRRGGASTPFNSISFKLHLLCSLSGTKSADPLEFSVLDRTFASADPLEVGSQRVRTGRASVHPPTPWNSACYSKCLYPPTRTCRASVYPPTPWSSACYNKRLCPPTPWSSACWNKSWYPPTPWSSAC